MTHAHAWHYTTPRDRWTAKRYYWRRCVTCNRRERRILGVWVLR